jgi:3-oxoacyl-[acyl-carrier protein] reductase
LEGKKALVTGGCKGIGLAIVKALEAEGCKVNSVCRCKGFDLTKDIDIKRTIALYSESDILINNVGGGGTWPDNKWEEVLEKNIYPMVELTSILMCNMRDKDWGRVITISSIFGKESGGTSGFTSAKSYQIAYMKSLSGDWDFRNITFNTVCPGPIKVDGKEMTYERYGQPEDVANLVTFLCSDKARWISGACITVDGGMSRSF